MQKQIGVMARPVTLPKIGKVKIPEIIFGVFVLICLLAASLIVYQNLYANKIFAGTKVAGISLSGKSKDEAKAILEANTKDFEQKEIEIKYEAEVQKVKPADLGISADIQNQVDQIYDIGRSGKFVDKEIEIIKRIFSKKNLPIALNINDEKLNQFLAPYNKKVTAPQNASLKIEGQDISVVPEKDGYALNTEQIKEQIKNEIGFLNFSPINIAIMPAVPIIYQDGVVQAKSEAEKIMALPITLTYENKAYQADGAQIGQFIKFEEKDKALAVSYNDEAILKYIAGLAAKIDIKPIDSEKLSTTSQITKEGTDGRALNRENTKAQIKEALKGKDKNIALTVDKKKHGEKTVFPDNVAVGGRFPGKYVDIDLSEQKLYAFDGENLARSFLISSGLPGTPTPTGTFSIYSRSRASLMAGPGYYLPNVQWVNRFAGSNSIHGTYWHHNFGHPMSHGCVNATNGDAQFIYEWAPMGTPVFIHK